jgi:transcriptional regulator with XRE-family HTH domain
MKKWAEVKAMRMSPERIERVQREAREELQALTLRELREQVGKTQAEVAELTRVTQSALSRLERRQDSSLEVVRRFVEALGGELELVARVGSKRFHVKRPAAKATRSVRVQAPANDDGRRKQPAAKATRGVPLAPVARAAAANDGPRKRPSARKKRAAS